MDAALAQGRCVAVAARDQHTVEGNSRDAGVPARHPGRCEQLQNSGPIHASSLVEGAGLPGGMGAAPQRINGATEGPSVLLVSRRNDSLRNPGVKEYRRLAHTLWLRRL